MRSVASRAHVISQSGLGIINVHCQCVCVCGCFHVCCICDALVQWRHMFCLSPEGSSEVEADASMEIVVSDGDDACRWRCPY